MDELQLIFELALIGIIFVFGYRYGKVSVACRELITESDKIASIIEDSSGVSGFHLNGEIADWSYFGDTVDPFFDAIVKAKQVSP